MATKQYNRCQLIKDINDYYKRKASKHGLQGHYKLCSYDYINRCNNDIRLNDIERKSKLNLAVSLSSSFCKA